MIITKTYKKKKRNKKLKQKNEWKGHFIMETIVLVLVNDSQFKVKFEKKHIIGFRNEL